MHISWWPRWSKRAASSPPPTTPKMATQRNPHCLLRLLAGLIEAPLGIHRSNLLVALENIDDGPLAAVVLVVFLSVRLADQRVRAQRHFVAVSHFFFGLTIEGGAENSDDQDSDAEVDDVAAVAARVPVQ